MDDHIVRGIEGAGVVVVEEGVGFVRTLGLHEDEPRRLPQAALGAEDDPISIIGPAIGHVVALGEADFVTAKVAGGEEFHLGHHNGLVARRHCLGRAIFELVGGDEEGIGRWVKDTCFMEVGTSGVVNQQL